MQCQRWRNRKAPGPALRRESPLRPSDRRPVLAPVVLPPLEPWLRQHRVHLSGESVRESVRASVRESMRESVRESVRQKER